MIIMVVSIYASAIVLSYIAAGKTLQNMEIESNLVVQNAPCIDVGEGPTSIAVDDWEDNKVYVANFLSNTVSVIDEDTLEVKNVNVGMRPDSIVVDESDNKVYVTNWGPDTESIDSVSVIDGDTLELKNVNVGTASKLIRLR